MLNRRTLLRWVASAAATLPFERLRLLAQPRDLTPEAVALLHEIAPTVLPSALGAARTTATVEKFVAWTRGYREGVAMTHGYGHPRLQKTGASPVPGYGLQLAALDRAARAKGARWSGVALDVRRALLDEAFTGAGVRNLPAHRDHDQATGATCMKNDDSRRARRTRRENLALRILRVLHETAVVR